jgi:cystathionine gamma-lyase
MDQIYNIIVTLVTIFVLFMSSLGFSTQCIHAGQPHDPVTGSVVPNIVLSSTFAQKSPGVPHGTQSIHSYGHGFEYSRTNNPTRATYELCCAALEGGSFAVAFSSGMAAISGALHLLKHGDNVLCIADAYGGTLRYINTICGPTYGITSTYADFAIEDLHGLLASQPKTTKMVWLETPSNPLLKVLDISAIAAAIRTVFCNDECLLVVDNTFMSPYFQRPLDLDADLVVEAATKFLNGHSDAVGGVVAGKSLALEKRLRHTQNALGAVPSPFDCYLVLRGIKTLPLRMKQSASNAMQVALFLEQHPAVESVIYPGLTSHPQHELSKRQMLNDGFGSMVVFYCTGGYEGARTLLEGFQLWTLAESLGAVESLVESPAIMTHASIPKEKREELGISDNLVRLSCGIENVQDLIQDLERALDLLILSV